MKTALYAIAAVLAAVTTAQAGERAAASSPASELRAQQRTLDARIDDRMTVSLDRSFELMAEGRTTPDDAYRVEQRWSGNDNEG